jgi:hypothetical protein
MASSDLASLAARLRQEGFDARNLGSVGITIWRDGHGYYFAAAESARLEALMSARTLEAALAQRAA